MPAVKKTFRIDEEIASELEKQSKEQGTTQTEFVEQAVQGAIQSAIHQPYRSHTQKSTENGIPKEVYEDLRRQLEIKDKQISDLSSALVAAQQSVAGAQALHGADVAAALAAPSQKKGFLHRLLGK